MSDDPRLDAATIAIIQEREQTPWLDNWAKAALVASDAVDGLRRALTPGTDEHEAAVERVGLVLAGHFSHGGDAEHAYRVNPRYRIYAGKVLAALRDLA
jgi:hypothetical protein